MSELKRALSTRHLSMIALGGAIGTGLFLACGSTLHTAGVWGTVAGYSIIGLMVYFLMSSLGEMSAHKPVVGSFCEYAVEYVNPSFGFAMMVNYWFNWAITLAAEISAGTIILQYWFPNISGLVVCFFVTLSILFLNLFSVRGFGESEYWLASIKVGMVMVFLIVGFSILSGFVGHQENQLTTQKSHINLFDTHSWLAIFNVMLIAGFSFQGSELIGVAAGESKNPTKDIPRAIGMIFWRILLFYILTIIVIGALIPASNPHLVGSDTNQVAYSPFTMVMQMAHIPSAASIINFVILTAVFSAANAGTYASSRTLYQLGTKSEGILSIFAKTSKNGVPHIALIATLVVGCLAFLTSYLGSGQVYTWLIAASALSGFIAWIGIAVSHLYFRRAFVREGGDIKALPYRSKFHPYGTVFSLVICLIVLFGQDTALFSGEAVNVTYMLLVYSSLILFMVIWLAHMAISFLKKASFIGEKVNEC